MGLPRMDEDVARGIAESALAAPGVTVLVGHAGVGKTNLALNLALAQARANLPVTLADLDLVNPYFRSSDYLDELEAAGVRVVAPIFARTALDTPSMGGELQGAIEMAGAGGSTGAGGSANAGAPDPRANASADAPARPRLVIDVGGDDLGATALGRYASTLRAANARLLYVVNAFRTLTSTPAEAVEVLREIEDHAHLRAHAIVNCSNLADQTSWGDVERGRTFAAEVAHLAGLPLLATVVPAGLAHPATPATPTPAGPQAPGATAPAAGTPGPLAASDHHEATIFVERFVRPPWE